MTGGLKAKERAQQALCDAWAHPEGITVSVLRDSGEVLKTRTRSAPWVMCGTAVILLDGISGGYRLDRVRVDT